MIDTITTLVELVGTTSTNIIVTISIVCLACSILLKIGEFIAPLTPTLRDDNAVKALGNIFKRLVELASFARKAK